jgi:hypothetical protein
MPRVAYNKNCRRFITAISCLPVRYWVDHLIPTLTVREEICTEKDWFVASAFIKKALALYN